MNTGYPRKKILMLITNLGFGGAERSFAKLSMLLSQYHEVYVAVFNRDSYTKESYTHGGTFIDLDVTTGNSVIVKAKAFLNRIRKIKAIKKQFGIEITISFLEGADYVNILAGGKDKKILSIRGTKKYDYKKTGAKGWLCNKVLIPFLYRKADVIVTVNRGISAELRNDFGINGQVQFQEIFNYYDIEDMRRQATTVLSADVAPLWQYPVLISHGRLSYEKRFQALLEVFALVKQSHKELRLVLVGDGPDYEILTNHCKNLGLSFAKEIVQNTVPDVFFAGFQSNPLAWLSKATVFAFPGTIEGFPNALAEAMIAGVAVVSTDCPWGPRDIMEGHDYGPILYPLSEIEETPCGILAPMLNQANATTAWATAIDLLLKDPVKRDQYRNRAVERMTDFSEDKIADLWLQLIHEISINVN